MNAVRHLSPMDYCTYIDDNAWYHRHVTAAIPGIRCFEKYIERLEA